MTGARTIQKYLDYLSTDTRREIYKVFNLVSRTLLYRYYRKKKKLRLKGENIALKRSDISSIIHLIDFHVLNHRFIKDSYIVHVGIKNLDEGDALKFFEIYVMGTVKDKYNRDIHIYLDAMKFLYKDRLTRKHIVHSYNFSDTRAKRLRWIRPTLEKTKEIYEKREKKWSTFLYVSMFEVPYINKSGLKQVSLNHFVVVCRKESGKPLKFKTAYHARDHNQLLKLIEPYHPFPHYKNIATKK